MTIPETVIIVLAALAAVFALAALIVACVRRRGDGVDADTLNDVRKMLEESANLRAQEIQSAVNNAKDVTLSVINQSNSSVATAIGTYLKGSGESMDKLIENTAKEMKEFRVTQEHNTEKINTGVEKSLKELKEETVRSIEKMQEDIRRQYNETRQELRANLDDIKKELTDNLGKVREDNNKQLEKMRETVDEKLSKTLEQRLTASFDIVKKELDSVNKNLQEMQTLGDNVKDINRVFQNVKTRGNWGETALAALLEELLDRSQYEEQFRVKSQNRVDFAIKMPGRDGGEVYLPIDSKFPIENYERLLAAQNDGDVGAMNEARKALEADLKSQAKSIKDKYISPPKTTDFAVMYLPSEGLYAEAMSLPGLSTKLRQDHQVVLGGPSVIAALLNSLQMGFRSLQLQKNSTEIRKAFDRFRKDFGKLNELISKAKERSEKVTKDLGEALDRNDKIKGTLGKYAIAAPEDEAAAAIDAPSEGDDES